MCSEKYKKQLIKKGFYISMNQILAKRNKYRPQYESAVKSIWGKPLTSIEAIADKSYSYILQYFKNTKEETSIDYAVATIVSKSYLKLEEIIVLLKSGYPDGAMAISRSLHELTTVLLFLIKYQDNNSLVLRYFDYSYVIAYKELRALKEVSIAMGDIFEREADLLELEEKRSNLTNQYGKSFIQDHGWIRCIEGINSFQDMEKAVGGNALRTFYQMGCNSIHSNSKTNQYSLGTVSEQEYILLSGPSYKGLEYPIRFTLASLSAILSALSAYINKIKVKSNIDAFNEIIIEILQLTNITSKKITH